ncbi:MAG: hypothetical protein WBB31_17900 [Saprospiraceae bacterium]
MMHILGTQIAYPQTGPFTQPMLSLYLKAIAQLQIISSHPAGG